MMLIAMTLLPALYAWCPPLPEALPVEAQQFDEVWNPDPLPLPSGADGLYGNPKFVPELFDPVAEIWTELPGYYMLFVLDQQGDPAVARFVEVGPWIEGDVDGSGSVSVSDLLAVLESWGPCAGCDADLDGDGYADVLDLLIVLANW